jgi:DNA-binding MarR family transcriptional regulator
MRTPLTAPDVPALGELMDETVALFHRLRVVAESVHRQGALSAGRRGLLRSLRTGGPQTVPQLARSRPVSRQHIQSLVNGLLADGLVDLAPNPGHRRSLLVRLTRAGERLVDTIGRRERELLRGMRLGIADRDLAVASETLRRVRRFFESAAWKDRVARVHGRAGPRRRRSP